MKFVPNTTLHDAEYDLIPHHLEMSLPSNKYKSPTS